MSLGWNKQVAKMMISSRKKGEKERERTKQLWGQGMAVLIDPFSMFKKQKDNDIRHVRVFSSSQKITLLKNRLNIRIKQN